MRLKIIRIEKRIRKIARNTVQETTRDAKID